MDNQHRKITGYRDLSLEEIDLMNRIKDFGPRLEELLAEVQDHVRRQVDDAKKPPADPVTLGRFNRTEPLRWTAIAKTHFQEGLMALTRAVAQPISF